LKLVIEKLLMLGPETLPLVLQSVIILRGTRKDQVKVSTKFSQINRRYWDQMRSHCFNQGDFFEERDKKSKVSANSSHELLILHRVKRGILSESP